MANVPFADWVVFISNNRPLLVGGGAEETNPQNKARYGPITDIVINDGIVTISLGHVARWDARQNEWFIPRDETGPGEIKFRASAVRAFADRFAAQQMVQFRAGNVKITLYTRASKIVRQRSNPPTR